MRRERARRALGVLRTARREHFEEKGVFILVDLTQGLRTRDKETEALTLGTFRKHGGEVAGRLLVFSAYLRVK